MVGWLDGWLVGRLVGWLVGWFIGLLKVRWLVGFCCRGLIGWLVGLISVESGLFEVRAVEYLYGFGRGIVVKYEFVSIG